MNDTNATDASVTGSVTPHREHAGLRGKLGATYFSLALIGAVLWPVQENWRGTPHDDFPLTYYPMFSAERERVETFYYVVGLDARGIRHTIPYGVLGSGGLNQVRRQLNRQVREGDAPKVARAVAETLARTDKWAHIASVEVCRGKYSVDAWFHGGKLPVLEQIKATCAVERTSP